METEDRNREWPPDLPRVREVGPKDNGWIVRSHATDRQMKALKQAVAEGHIFATEAEFDEFWKENEWVLPQGSSGY